MTTKQYTREEINRHMKALYLELPESIADINAAMLRQCLARIDQLEAEPGEAEVEAVAAAIFNSGYDNRPTAWADFLEHEDEDDWGIAEETRKEAKAAISAFLNARRG